MVIVINTDHVAMCSGESAVRVNEQGEDNLIKVTNSEGGFYYIGTLDRDSYILEEVTDLPEDFRDYKYKYVGDEFILNPDFVE